jgi:hypothetical protein
MSALRQRQTFQPLLGGHLVQVQQFVVVRRVVRRARHDDEAERETLAVGADVNSARGAAARTAEGLAALRPEGGHPIDLTTDNWPPAPQTLVSQPLHLDGASDMQ